MAMLGEEKLARINELARKQRTVGLSEAEQAEQHALRQAYLEAFRASFRAQLEAQGLRPRTPHGASCPCCQPANKEH